MLCDEGKRIITSDNPEMLPVRFEKGYESLFPKGPVARIPLSIPPQTPHVFGLKITVPADVRPGEVLRIDVVQRDGDDGQVLGGVAIEIHVS